MVMDPRYRPPRSNLDLPTGAEAGIRIRAVAFGAAVDVGCTFVFAVALGIVLGFVLLSGGTDPEDLARELEELAKNDVVMLGSSIVGLCFTILGGYVAGRIAGHSQIRHGLLTGVVSMALGSLLGTPWGEGVPLWYTVSALLLPIPAAGFGGWLSEPPSSGFIA